MRKERESPQAVEREGSRCLLIPGDVSDPDFCREAVHKTVKEFGKLDVLVTGQTMTDDKTNRSDQDLESD